MKSCSFMVTNVAVIIINVFTHFIYSFFFSSTLQRICYNCCVDIRGSFYSHLEVTSVILYKALFIL